MKKDEKRWKKMKKDEKHMKKNEHDQKPIVTTLLYLHRFRIVLGGFYLYLLSGSSFDYTVRKEYVNTLCQILTLKENIKKNDSKTNKLKAQY